MTQTSAGGAPRRLPSLRLPGPIDRSLTTVGQMASMSATVTRHLFADLARGRFPWGEFILQAWFVTSVSLLPALLVAIPFGVIVAINVGSLAAQVGATSFVGAVNGLGVIREGAPVVTALLLAGAAGSAICSDLGARTIREEMDAMRVMGISPVRRLVVPRVAALMVVGVLLCALVAMTGVLAGYLFNVYVQHGTAGAYLSSFTSFATAGDFIVAEIKAAIFGFLTAIVAAHKGLNAKGGPKGVADGVNQSVVFTFLLLFSTNIALTQAYLLIAPPKVV
ncbi:MAG TPA: ABC transporter permease [Sporichthyaceae bacterium]|jgi:phospholipid/cholesterol/gamma-HCH transport system permease protein|nr:ABC transporter permease [Sporichthyaceae bacterium]